MSASSTPSKGPPADVPVSELWAALTSIPRPWQVVDFPRVDPITKEPLGQVAIWVLTQEEQIAASAEADQVAKRVLKDPQRAGEANLGYENIYNNESTVQVLYRACRDIKDVSRPAFPSASMLRKQLSIDEISVLAVLYMQVQASIGPIVSSMTVDEEELWIGRLAQAGNIYPIAALSLREQERLLVSLACRLASSLMVTSSPGSAPSDGGTNEAPKPESDLVIEAKALDDEDFVASGS